MTSIPRAISADSVRHVLASISRRTELGRRDFAILLLLARLGLRSSEAAFLELDDIDWDTGQVSIRGKGGADYFTDRVKERMRVNGRLTKPP